MTKRLRSKYKLNRRLGENIWGRAKCPLNRRDRGPGQHGARRRKPSDYALQLRAKQKLRGYYGNITETQFRNIYRKALRARGDTSEAMIGLLESRLDAVVYRAKLAVTPFAARQLVSHGHVLVNGMRATIASMRVKGGDMVQIRERSRQMTAILTALGDGERSVPDYLVVDPAEPTRVTVSRIPEFGEVPYPVRMEPNLVIEYYSR